MIPRNTMNMLLVSLLMPGLLSSPSFALVVQRSSVTERVENSSLVVIGQVVETARVKDSKYSMSASIEVKESSVGGHVGQRITFYHLGDVEDEATLCCGVGLTYLLFLKEYRDGYSSAAHRFGAYEIVDKVPWFLDETTMRTSLEHAEILLFLHRLSQGSSRDLRR